MTDDADNDDIILVENEDWEDIAIGKDELDLNDELFVMQDM